MMGPAYMPDYMGWMMFGSWLFWIVVIVAVSFVALRLLRTDGRRGARGILDERLARGEIDAEEYRTRLAILEG